MSCRIAMKHELLAILTPHGQEHLLAFWDQLDPRQRESLAAQIRAIDFDLVRRLYEQRERQGNFRQVADRAGPPPAFRLDASQNRFTPEQARARGNQAAADGELGVILVAGGQGTRLGFDHPKGVFPIGPVSGKTLFQIHVEKIVAKARRHCTPHAPRAACDGAGVAPPAPSARGACGVRSAPSARGACGVHSDDVRIPLYLMTSPATHDETVAFFAEHDRFGLAEEDLRVFCQGTMPAVDAATGRVLLESPGRIATSPDGHGGMLVALVRSGALSDIERRGTRHLFYFQVDNPLVDICGSEFVGYHLLSGAEFSSQVIAKRDPLQRVGNVVEVDGRLMVIEYSDLPDDAAARRNPDGSLAIWAGSIAVHVMDAALLRRLSVAADALPFHVARKKVACLDSSGNRIEPREPNAIKFERFIFDLMPSARNAIVVEVDPQRAFAPLKNASGAKEDTPESVRAQLSALHREWLRQAGAEVSDDAPVEISPLFALDAAELAAHLPPGTRITKPTYFG